MGESRGKQNKTSSLAASVSAESSNPHSPLLGANLNEGTIYHTGSSHAFKPEKSSDPRSSLLGAIKSRGKTDETNMIAASGSEGSSDPSPLGTVRVEVDDSSSNILASGNSPDPRSSLLGAIENKGKVKVASTIGASLDPRSSLLGAIKSRGKEDGAESCGVSSLVGSSNRRSSLQSAIKSIDVDPRGALASEGTPDPRSSLLGAIRNSSKTDIAEPRSSLLGAIKNRGTRDGVLSNSTTFSKESLDPRSSLLGAIKNREVGVPSGSPVAEGAVDPQSSLLGAIKNRGKENVGDGNSTSASDRSSDPRSSMLGAIKCRGLQDDANLDTMSTGESDPRSSMLGAIKSGKTLDVSSDPRSSMLNAIKMSSERKLANLDHDTKITRNVSLIEIPTARSSLLATIRNRLKENKGKSCTKSAILGVMTG